ncbi:MAG TPA: class F sortase [Streptosporangiaceae bacterium]|nr:class F sortase [Streptosporangiaceae bacterium]
MSEPGGPGRDTRRRPGRWWVLSGVLLLIATGSFVVALHSHRDPLAGPVASPSVPVAAPPSAAAAQPGVARPAVARSAPVALRIPAIGVAVAVSALGLNPDGTVQVPASFQEPGWYRLGPSPGQVGSAVILGHVDSYQGPAVFFRLRSLRPGDRVEVILADGVTVHFVVDVVAMYPKNQFPARLVYGSRGYAALQLVTCGGAFDTSTRSYLSNVVVYTSLVATTSAAAGPRAS